MGFMPFSKGNSPKVKVIAWLEFEIVYYDVAVQLTSHHTMCTPLYGFKYSYLIQIIMWLQKTNNNNNPL